MERKLYERECLIRSPEFRRDLEKLRQVFPRLFDLSTWVKDEQGRPVTLVPTDAEAQALRENQEKYPQLGIDYVGAILQPAPLLFDPAWKRCVDHAVIEFWSRHGRPPTGVVTRAAVEPPGESGDAEEVYGQAREFYEAVPEEQRAGERRRVAPETFRGTRLAVAIGPETTLEQIRRLWPTIRKAQRACYGSPARRRSPRRGVYEMRLLAYDLIRNEQLTVKTAAARARVSPTVILRRFQEALADIEGIKPRQPLDAETFGAHIQTCPNCRKAKTSDEYCPWIQRRLGARSGTVKGRVDVDSTALADPASPTSSQRPSRPTASIDGSRDGQPTDRGTGNTDGLR